ncbi:flagellar hook-basal body complex protein [bacterium]|nr:flagellar hook-basal body complex protein [bacterium]
MSSLQNQRRRIDVIGTNISNINTIGYKSSRMTFLEMMGQTVGKLYTPFQQGSFTATGSVTDIAVDGQSFFVLKDANGDYVYSRAGAFFFDEEGRLVNQNRETVQGWMADDIIDEGSTTSFGASDLNAVGAISNVVLDPDMTVGAIATNNIWFGGNINAGLEAVKNVIRSTDTMRYELDGIVHYATPEIEINNLVQVTTDLENGDEILISGTLADGTVVEDTAFVYGTDGTTVGELIDKINAIFSGSATAAMVNGKIVMTDDGGGDSLSHIKLAVPVELIDGEEVGTNTGEIVMPVFVTETHGLTPTATASIIVYDSFGTAHHLSLEFIKTENVREWAWEATVEGDETITGGEAGKITFDAAGNYIANTYDDGTGALVIKLPNGADDLNIQIHAGGGEGISGLSQYDAVTTVSVRLQDGQASGSLEGINIDEDGFIVGTFSNSVVMNLAQISLAEFDDPTSLEKVGTGNFVPTNWSGDAILGRANDFDTTLMAGHLETSNVDLAEQFIQMLDAQQAYSASSRIVATLDRVMQETTQFGR